jgi:hypothetical protein
LGEPWICPLNITTQLAPRDMRGREEAHEEKNKNIAVEYESLDTYSPFTFRTDSGIQVHVYIGNVQLFI